MLYYIYISTTKLQMLASQEINNSKIKIKGEAKLKVPFISEVKIAFEAENKDRDSNISKVVNAVKDTKSLSDLDLPTMWIKDHLEVKAIAIEDCPDLFLLIGKKHGTYHMLGGSADHIVGNVKSEKTTSNYSYFPYLSKKLSDVFGAIRFRNSFELQIMNKEAGYLIGSIRSHEWSEVVKELYESCLSEVFKVEFLARSLAVGECLSGERVTASSPLYVASI